MAKLFTRKEDHKSTYQKVAHLTGAAHDLIKLAERVDIEGDERELAQRDALDIVLEKYKSGEFDHLTTKQMVSMLFDNFEADA